MISSFSMESFAAPADAAKAVSESKSTMASQKIWNRDKINALIENVKSRPCLWNVKSAEYHNQRKRSSAVLEIANTLEVSEEEVKRKIHTLRAQYSKERSKMRSHKSDSDTSQIYKTKWEFFDSLKFMFRHNEENHAVSPVVGANGTEEESNPGSSDVSIENASSAHKINVNKEDQKKRLKDKQRKSSNSLQPNERERKSDSNQMKMLKRAGCMAILSKAAEKDEYFIFGENVANEIRGLRDAPDLQFKLKIGIQKLIFEVSSEYGARKFAGINGN